MKHDIRLQMADFRPAVVILCLYLTASAAEAVTANPYEAIVGRNVFGLKPPTPTTLPPVVTAAAAITIKLQGVSTILDRKQVLLKVITAARPPAPAKEQSYLWSEGQGEDDIEVIAIDAAAGTVKIKNRDETLSLTMKDDAEKPAVGAALPGPAALPQLPGVPAPANAGQLAPGGGGPVTTIGNPRTIPTRTLRSSPGSNPAGPNSGFFGGGIGSGADAGSGTPSGSLQNNLSPEAQAILIEAARAQISGGFDPLPKTGLTPPR